MPSEILAVGITAESSADIEIGYPTTVALKDEAGPGIPPQARVDIFIKDDVGQYFLVDRLDSVKPALVISGSGTYRFTRKAGASCGVFSA